MRNLIIDAGIFLVRAEKRSSDTVVKIQGKYGYFHRIARGFVSSSHCDILTEIPRFTNWSATRIRKRKFPTTSASRVDEAVTMELAS